MWPWFGPGGSLRGMSALAELRQTVARLRAPGGCPWDQEQTHGSLVRCLIDEVSELMDTIDRLDKPHMREELGDVLLQVVFHAQIAEEEGHFDLEEVAREINEKLVRRHPHVFGESGKLGTSADVLVKWDEIKAAEKKNGPAPSGIFKEMPPQLPALMFAEAVWKEVGKKKLEPGPGVDRAEVAGLGEGMDEAELGRRLFALAAVARERGWDAEGALRLHTKEIMRHAEASAAAATA